MLSLIWDLGMNSSPAFWNWVCREGFFFSIMGKGERLKEITSVTNWKSNTLDNVMGCKGFQVPRNK